MSEIVVLTDGDCRFCEATLAWMQKKLTVNAIAYQRADLAVYGLTFQECEKAVHVVADGRILVGADAIAFLLKRRGNSITSTLITASGPLGRIGYKWVAGHRDTALIKAITRLIEKSL